MSLYLFSTSASTNLSILNTHLITSNNHAFATPISISHQATSKTSNFSMRESRLLSFWDQNSRIRDGVVGISSFKCRSNGTRSEGSMGKEIGSDSDSEEDGEEYEEEDDRVLPEKWDVLGLGQAMIYGFKAWEQLFVIKINFFGCMISFKTGEDDVF